ncbi:MAG: hypothetical protein J1E01_04835 [Acetatifactor sp.]|nr:hypothetical protein [Acetatifactor sp.]
MINVLFAVFLAFCYSIAYIVVGPMIAAQDIKFDQALIFPFVLCFTLCLVFNFFLFFAIPKLRLCTGNGRISQYLDKVGKRKLFLLVWAFLFVSWIPAYLILYPGVLSYDMISQVGSALGEITNNHHPVLHTWLIRIFMKLGDTVFHNYESGIGLLSLLQMLILSYALARLVFLLKKKNVPILIVMLTALFSAIWFMNACLSVTMIKDSLHAAFLILFACHFTEIATDPSEYSQRKQNLFVLPVISFLMCAFRNNGIHIYIFCFVALFILRISKIKKAKAYIALITVVLLPVFMYKIYTGPVFAAFGIAQGEVREALSVPIQQMQRVAVMKTDELTSEQTEKMKYYITDLAWMDWQPERYNPFWADPAKNCFISIDYDEDPIAFWRFYLQIGGQFSKEYVVAFLSNTLGYWYPGYYKYSYVMYENYSPEAFVEPLERKSIWDSHILKKYYESVCSSDFWRETPVLRLFFVPGFTLWFLLYALALAWKKRGFFTKVLPLFLPLIAQYGIMILSPMSSFRYAWPFYLMLPLAFIGICGNLESCILNGESTEARLGR